MHIKTVIAFLISTCWWLQSSGQGLHVDSTRFITGTKPNTAINFAVPTADKGCFFAGSALHIPGGIIPSFPLDTNNENVLIGKIDSDRQISWMRVYGGTWNESAASACQTADGGYGVLCITESNDGDITDLKSGPDIWVIKTDAMGNKLWAKCYGSSNSDLPISIAGTADNGLIILGATNGSDGDVPFHYGGFFSMDWVVIKTDSAGNVQWSKTIGGSDDELSSGSILPLGSNYYLVSETFSKDHDCTDTLGMRG